MTICHSIFCHSILLLMLYFLRMLYSWRCYPFYPPLTISKIESQYVSISQIFINFLYNCVFCHYYIRKNSFEFHFNSLANWVMARPSKFLRVISAGPLNFLQRDFEKYSSSRKKLYSRKNPKPKNDVFFDFRPKNNSFWYEKILSLRNFSKIFCKKSLNFMLNVPNIKFWKSEFLKCWSNFWNALHILLVSAAWATDFWIFLMAKFFQRMGGGWLSL